MSEVEVLATQALWYAWGQIDAGRFPGMDLDAGFAFKAWYKALALKYARGEACSRPSILSEWNRFATAGRVQVA